MCVCAGGCEEAGGAEEVTGKGGGGGKGGAGGGKGWEARGGTVGVLTANTVRVTVVVMFVVVSFLTKPNPIHSITSNTTTFLGIARRH